MAKKKKQAQTQDTAPEVTAAPIDGEALDNIPMADEVSAANTTDGTPIAETETAAAITDVEEITKEAARESTKADTPCEDLPAKEAVTDAPHKDISEKETVSRETTDTDATQGEQFGMATISEAAANELFESDEAYKKLGLYIHIPFCKSKCAYCDFCSTDQITASSHRVPEAMKQYVRALKNHMRILSERTTQYNVDTVFIGGGTPTALPAKLLLDIVKEVKRDFYLDENYEFTVEMNPATANKSLLKKLRRSGVNRLSIGLQSAHNHELAALSRIHTVGDFSEAFQTAREAGFDNINIDVMYGIPEQTKDSFLDTLAFVASMKPEHISMYNLRIEDGTPFGERRHMLPLPDEDIECDMYFEGIAYLESQGYHQYEISNFAKERMECRHNLKYWHGEEYIGCGVAAHSYFGGNRFSFKRSLSEYNAALQNAGHHLPKSLLDETYRVDKKEEVAEYIMLRLRLAEGIDTADFQTRFGSDFDTVFANKLKVYLDHDYMRCENGRYFFTPKGFFVSNFILSRIIPFEPKIGKNGSI